MTERILCVDDDPNVLQAYQRSLRKRFVLEPAVGANEALQAIREQGPYAVVVADMRMPGMNGIELLARVREISPQTVRIMLTGHADQTVAVDAVNQGHIFRFLTKPCPPDQFAAALDAGLEQWRLIVAERELLSNTLRGSIKMLTDVLALVNPTAFGRASRVRRLTAQLCAQLKLTDAWAIEIAAMLSQVGCVLVPEETLSKVFRGEPLSREEQEVYEAYPREGRMLIENIPRLESVAEMIAYQEKTYDGQGFPRDQVQGDDLPVGSRVLKLALDVDTLITSGMTYDVAIAEINDREGTYDPKVVDALREILDIRQVHVVRRMNVQMLPEGAILADDIRSINGTLLCARGQEVTPSMRAKLRNYVANVGVQSPIRVFMPADLADEVQRRGNTSETLTRSEW